MKSFWSTSARHLGVHDRSITTQSCTLRFATQIPRAWHSDCWRISTILGNGTTITFPHTSFQAVLFSEISLLASLSVPFDALSIIWLQYICKCYISPVQNRSALILKTFIPLSLLIKPEDGLGGAADGYWMYLASGTADGCIQCSPAVIEGRICWLLLATQLRDTTRKLRQRLAFLSCWRLYRTLLTTDSRIFTTSR